MKTSTVLLAVGLILAMVWGGSAQAQTWSTEQNAVWEVVSSTWERDLKQDSGWIQDTTHASVSAWGMSYPAPRNKASIGRWAEHGKTVSTLQLYELAPHAISVAGNAAIAHYHYSTANKSAEGKVETTHGRCSDTLVRDGDRWVFLGWSCSDEPKAK